MTKRTNDKNRLTDPAAAHLEVYLYPFVTETQAAVVLVRGYGGHSTCLRVWAGRLPGTRSSLAGLRASDLTIVLCGQLRDALARADDEAVAPPADSISVGGIGAPLGATGGTVGQAELPLDFG